MVKKNKNIKSDIIPANPNIKVSFFKKIHMYINAKRNKFSFFRKTNKHWRYYRKFLDDVIAYGVCGTLIALPFTSFIQAIFFGLSFGSILFIYSEKIHKLIMQLFSQLRLVNIGNNIK